MKKFLFEVLVILRDFGWRSFGALLVVLSGGAAAGGILLHDALLGVFAAWLTVVLTALGIIGAVIMVTGKATRKDVADAWKRAGKDLVEEQDKTKK